MELMVVADELTAVGWRLAGARVLIPDPRSVEVCFQTALRDAHVVLITAELASAIPAAQLQEALRAQPPLVLVIADLREGQEPPDMEDETRRALGVAV
jgi:vacuolar-type H+-ATPase subunit F/Vma7